MTWNRHRSKTCKMQILGKKTIAWTPDADIVIVEPARDGPKRDVAVAADDTKIYDNAILEVPPIFPGGMDKFYQYLSKSLRYPPMAAESNIQGKVFVSFVVDKNGMLTDIKVVRSSQIYLLST